MRLMSFVMTPPTVSIPTGVADMLLLMAVRCPTAWAPNPLIPDAIRERDPTIWKLADGLQLRLQAVKAL